MSGLFALLGTSSLVFRPGIIEGSQVDLLRVRWQMRPNRRGKVIDGCDMASASSASGKDASNKESIEL